MSYPITKNYLDNHWAFCAFIGTGVVVFCVQDWGRGDIEIVSRANGRMAGRDLQSLHALGSCQPFNDECYPNLESAAFRFPDVKDLRPYAAAAPSGQERSDDGH